MDTNGREDKKRTADEPAVAKAMAGKLQIHADGAIVERCLPAAAGRGRHAKRFKRSEAQKSRVVVESISSRKKAQKAQKRTANGSAFARPSSVAKAMEDKTARQAANKHE
jgi:hypothetical protein